MQINLVYEPSVAEAPAGFSAALQYAARELDALITNNITVSIDIAWDTSGQILGLSSAGNMTAYSYGDVVAALKSHAGSPAALAAADALPGNDPTGGDGVYLSIAQQEALGLLSGTSTLDDGTVTLGTGGEVLNFSTTDLAVAGEMDFNGVALGELTHALGRAGWGDGSFYSLMDLFRYAAPGALVNDADVASATSPPAYFSTDGGQTGLADYATSSDYYDWAANVPDDSFDAVSEAGVANTLSAVDQELMAALGFDVACFCPGTRIATPDGEVPVEELAIGDAVMTREGARRIKWIGRSAYVGRFIGGNPLMLPVTFAPGALGEGLPRRPLTVSPGHGMCLCDVLVPAWRLVNQVNVTQPARVERVNYVHIELERHGLLLTEGVWSESYLNETPRSWFQNAAEFYALYPGEDVPGPACLPRVEEGVALEALRHMVNSRAGLAPVVEPAGPLRGEVDYLANGVCAGWAQCADAPEVPVTLLVMRGGEILARVVANRYRAELRAAGDGRFCSGFVVAVPEERTDITVRRALDGAVLPMAGVVLAAA
jgi:Hint domain